MQNIINIILILAVVYVIYRLSSVEKMSNIDKATEDKIREIYKIDTDAIRNLSNLAKDLTVGGKLTVPGGLDVKGKMNIDQNTYVKGLLKVNRTDDHPWNAGWGNGVHTWDMKVDASADINNLSVRKNVNIANDLVFNGKNNWIFHTPNDGRHIVYISPSKAQGNTNWDWGKGMELHPDGKVVIKNTLNSKIINTPIINVPRINISNSFIDEYNLKLTQPIIINFNRPSADHSYHNRTFTIPNQTLFCILWWDNTANSRVITMRQRFSKLKRIPEANVRDLADFRNYRQITLCIPQHKSVKIWGWSPNNIIRVFNHGYHQVNLDFSPHALWAGWNEFSNDVPNSYNPHNNTF